MSSIDKILKEFEKMRYQMLSRFQSDCKYYLGNGNRLTKYLWGCDEEEHINSMIKLYDSFSIDEKPEWLTFDDILTYAKDMLNAPLKLSQNEYLQHYGYEDFLSGFLDDKAKGNLQLKSEKGQQRFKKESLTHINNYHDERQRLIKQYDSLVEQGIIIPKTKLEIRLETARGHYENRNVQATRRMLLKTGINWLTGKEIQVDKKSIENKLHLTHDEFHEYKQELAKKIWGSEKYSISDFTADCKKVEVIGFDLEQYHIPDEIKMMIDRDMSTHGKYCDHETFFGFIELDEVDGVAREYQCGYGLPYGYSGYYRNNENMMIINYAEGDFNISLYTDRNIYNNAVIRTHNFYEKSSFYYFNGNVWSENEISNQTNNFRDVICIFECDDEIEESEEME